MMHAAIPFPDISPDIFTLHLFGLSFSLRWYATAYLVGIILGWFLARAAIARARLWVNETPPMSRTQLDDLMTWLILGVVLGGRIGFVLFYQPEYYLAHPSEIPMVWHGGMSFHGGLIGVTIALLIFCRRQAVSVIPAMDMLALATPPGLMLGRIANFINGELWGRHTDMPWGVIFPSPEAQHCAGVVGLCARHPSQLYEAGLEGLVLGTILLILAFGTRALKHPGLTTGVFIMGYGIARFTVELFRLADPQFITPGNPHGHVIRFGEGYGLTMGQVLSVPLILLGLAFILRAVAVARRKAPA